MEAEAGVKADLDGPLSMPRLGEPASLVISLLEIRVADKQWIPVPFHSVGTFWVSPLFRLKSIFESIFTGSLCFLTL